MLSVYYKKQVLEKPVSGRCPEQQAEAIMWGCCHPLNLNGIGSCTVRSRCQMLSVDDCCSKPDKESVFRTQVENSVSRECLIDLSPTLDLCQNKNVKSYQH